MPFVLPPALESISAKIFMSSAVADHAETTATANTMGILLL
jgi:hypothetical protein